MDDFQSRMNGDSTYSLILTATVNRTQYHEAAVDAACSILAERGIDLSLYDEDFYVDKIATNYGKGWEQLIRIMFSKLTSKGWNRNIAVYHKEKYGAFQIRLFTDDETLKKIAEEFTEKINCSCEICGAPGEDVDVGWIYTLCEAHFIEISDIVYNADEGGFTTGKNQYLWKEIKKINLLQRYFNTPSECFEDIAEAEMIFFGNRKNMSLTSGYINWLLLLKFIPPELAPPWLHNQLDTYMQNLTYCPVCKFKAVHDDYCHRCNFQISSIESSRDFAKEMGRVFDENEHISEHRSFLEYPFRKKLLSMEKYFVRCSDK